MKYFLEVSQVKKHHERVKEKLINCINEMSNCRYLYAKNPKTDFTRNRKLSFDNLIKFLLVMGGNNIRKELTEHYDFDVGTITTSGFIQQRQKLLPYALEYLFHDFTNSFKQRKKYKNHRLFAIDGSALNIPNNPNDLETHISCTGRRGHNSLHLNAMYDLCNQIYTDALVQTVKLRSEYKAFNSMVDRSNISGKVIVTADRGYESYNLFAHVEQKGWNYVVRVKDVHSTGMLSSFILPEKDEFDIDVNLILTRRQTKQEKSSPNSYKYLSKSAPIDYLESIGSIHYPITLRVLRIKVSDESYESIITNLDRNIFTPKHIKEIYSLRWGIETSFRKLKYTIGLINFHAKKVDTIIQEIFSRLIMYNFCEIIIAHIIVSTKSSKYHYKVNFTFAVLVCKRFLKTLYNARPPDVETLLGKNTFPVRNGRSLPRNMRSKSSVSFLYRVA